MDDRYRPRFHFTAPADWINDPNGLVYDDGEYHLFYQHIRRKHWGHAVSTDLVHWHDLPIALAPDALGQIYSGSVVVDRDDSSGLFGGRAGLVAVFTHHNKQQAPLGPQVQSLAYSSDRGRTWTMYEGNPVIPNPGIDDFRDPKVFWHQPSRSWILVLVCRDTVRFYRSANLRDWTQSGEFGAGYGVRDVPWECPDLFELPVEGAPGERRWVLHVSVFPRGRRAAPEQRDMEYFIGIFDGATFHSETPPQARLWSSYGRDEYASIAWPPIDAAGRLVWIGWMNNWDYARDIRTGSWQGAMTIPRELSLRRTAGGLRLIQQPLAALASLRERGEHWSERPIAPAAPLPLPDLGEALEVVAVLQPGTARECGLRIRSSATEQTTVGYDGARAELFVDRTHSGDTQFNAQFPGRHGGPLAAPDGTVTLHLFLDRCSVEVFGNQGDAVVTSLIFPRSAPPTLECYAEGGEARLLSLDVYPLRSIWAEGDRTA